MGRTGDSSSPHPSSPFKRIGQHLDAGPNAKGNALAKQLKRAGLAPEDCTFEMVAVGPLFPEQEDMERNKAVRDKAAALERALADHPRAAKCDEAVCAEVCRLVDERLAALGRG